MPILTNNRRERFCQGIAKGLSAVESYRRAGYKAQGHGAEVSASQILTNLEVQGRIDELQQRAVLKHEITVDSLTRDLLFVRDNALRTDQNAAAVAALTLLAKIHGFLVDHKTVDIVHHKPARQPTKQLELTEDEWLRLYDPAHWQAIASPGRNGNGRNA
jgi:phage terminase small subunit